MKNNQPESVIRDSQVVRSSQTEPPTITSPTVFLGMSGGVDSSLSAVLLKEQGYKVVGVYMKNWSKDLPGMKCPWTEDLADAKRVAVKLGIDFRVFDFETEYRQKVVDYMLAEFKKGRTPNPDIMCNQEIKFKLFYETAREQGADLIATGHYAQIGHANPESAHANSEPAHANPEPAHAQNQLAHAQNQLAHANSEYAAYLKTAVDDNKDQTYFLYRISEEAIAHTLFPIGHLKKPEVKKLAEEKGLANAYKKESMGVCFVGDVGMNDFLREYFREEPGPILEAETNKRLGTHEGSIFYTIGQRHGLDLGGGLPYYVVRKDVTKNIIYVSQNLNNDNLWTTSLALEDVVLRKQISRVPETIQVRLRHRAPLVPAKLSIDVTSSTLANSLTASTNPLQESANISSRLTEPQLTSGTEAKLIFEKPIKRPATGQSAVFYDGDNCFGGGIIKA